MYPALKANKGEEWGPISSTAGGCMVDNTAVFRPHTEGCPKFFWFGVVCLLDLFCFKTVILDI